MNTQLIKRLSITLLVLIGVLSFGATTHAYNQGDIKVIYPNGGEVLKLSLNGKPVLDFNAKVFAPSISFYSIVFISRSGVESGFRTIWNTSNDGNLKIEKTAIPANGDYKIRFCLVDQNYVSVICDESDNYFTIADDSEIESEDLKVLSPNSGENLKISSSGKPVLPIAAKFFVNKRFNFQLLNLSFVSKSGVESGIHVVKVPDWSLDYTIPLKYIPTSNGDYKLKLCIENSFICDRSDNYFTISDNFDLVKVVSPNGGENLKIGLNGKPVFSMLVKLSTDARFGYEPYDLSFDQNSPFVPAIFSLVSKSGVESGIHEVKIYNGTLDYTVPINYMPTSNGEYKVKLCIRDKNICDLSDNYFSISNGPDVIKVVSPNGGEKLAASLNGNAISITTKLSVDQMFVSQPVDISFVSRSGVETGAHGIMIPNGNSDYTIPIKYMPKGSGEFKIKLCVEGTIVCDTSDDYFSIVDLPASKFQVLSPNGYEKLPVSLNDKVSASILVKLVADKNLFGTYPLYLSFVSKTGIESGIQYNIKIPSGTLDYVIPLNYMPNGNGDYKIKFCILNSTFCDLSDNYFSLVDISADDLKVVSPNGEEKLEMTVDNHNKSVELSASFLINQTLVTLPFTFSFVSKTGIESGKHDIMIPSSTFDYTIPLAYTPTSNGDYKIKLCLKESEICSQSNDYFSISYNLDLIKVISPNGGENLMLSRKGKPTLSLPVKVFIGNVSPHNIVYSFVSRSGVESESRIIKNSDNNTDKNLSLESSVVVANGDYKIKMCLEGTTICDLSDNYFTISDNESLKVTYSPKIVSPNGGEKLEVLKSGVAVKPIVVNLNNNDFEGPINFSFIDESNKEVISGSGDKLFSKPFSILPEFVPGQGQYKLKVCVVMFSLKTITTNAGNVFMRYCDTSDDFFTIDEINPTQYSCNKGDWYGKESNIGLWLKKDETYNPDARFLCHTDKTIYRCTKDTDEAGNASYWNTFSTRIGNGAPTKNYVCSLGAGKWVDSKSSEAYSAFSIPVPIASAPTLVAVPNTSSNVGASGNTETVVAGGTNNLIVNTVDNNSSDVAPSAPTPIKPQAPANTSIKLSEIFCNKGDWVGKDSVIGIWFKKDTKYNFDTRFLCHTDKTIYRCTKDTDEAGNASYWNTFSTRIGNGAPTPNYTCDTNVGSWIKVVSQEKSSSFYATILSAFELFINLFN